MAVHLFYLRFSSASKSLKKKEILYKWSHMPLCQFLLRFPICASNAAVILRNTLPGLMKHPLEYQKEF